jgi:hypothetical protein
MPYQPLSYLGQARLVSSMTISGLTCQSQFNGLYYPFIVNNKLVWIHWKNQDMQFANQYYPFYHGVVYMNPGDSIWSLNWKIEYGLGLALIAADSNPLYPPATGSIRKEACNNVL